jgi:hypothetical protein
MSDRRLPAHGANELYSREEAAMNVPVLERHLKAETRLSVVDCDIHPTLRSLEDLKPFL